MPIKEEGGKVTELTSLHRLTPVSTVRHAAPLVPHSRAPWLNGSYIYRGDVIANGGSTSLAVLNNTFLTVRPGIAR
jgi:hypothetical protein